MNVFRKWTPDNSQNLDLIGEKLTWRQQIKCEPGREKFVLQALEQVHRAAIKEFKQRAERFLLPVFKHQVTHQGDSG